MPVVADEYQLAWLERHVGSWHELPGQGIAPVRQKLGVQLPKLRGPCHAKVAPGSDIESSVSVRTICGFDYGVGPPGRRTVNTEPRPGALVTVTSPPIMRASLRDNARPSPVPP